ncbi:sugar phosphate isomerase/epimerase family protein [Paenibacillus sp. BAC0078]
MIYDWFGYELPIKERYQLIKEAGLFIENIHTPIQNENCLWLDNLEGEALTDCYLQCVADCAEFEIPTMVVHLPHEDNPYNLLGLDRIKRITEKAEQLGVNVALENLRNLTNLEYVLEQVDSLRIGFCYDCGHHYNYYSGKDLLSMYSGATAIEAMNWDYEDLSAKEFLHKAFERAKRLEALKAL